MLNLDSGVIVNDCKEPTSIRPPAISKLLAFPLADSNRPFAEADPDFQFAAAVASFGMQLRQSKWVGQTSLDAVLEMAQAASKSDEFGYRTEFLQIVRSAKEWMPK